MVDQESANNTQVWTMSGNHKVFLCGTCQNLQSYTVHTHICICMYVNFEFFVQLCCHNYTSSLQLLQPLKGEQQLGCRQLVLIVLGRSIFYPSVKKTYQER